MKQDALEDFNNASKNEMTEGLYLQECVCDIEPLHLDAG